MKTITTFVMCCAACVMLITWSGIANAEPSKEAMLAYLDGIEALEKAQWAEAQSAFALALKGDNDNAKFALAHGVASVLGEQFSAAEADLKRVIRLTNDNREAKLWLLTLYQILGWTGFGGGSGRCKQDCKHIDTAEIQKLTGGPGYSSNACYYKTVSSLGRAHELRDSPELQKKAEREQHRPGGPPQTDACGNDPYSISNWTEQSARAGVMFAALVKGEGVQTHGSSGRRSKH